MRKGCKASGFVLATVGLLASCGAPNSFDESVESTTDPAVYCPDFGQDLEELTLPTTFPNGAVGYLNNGCTAVLIDPFHIVAAGHCAANRFTGAWQTGLRFYPNFHPDRASPPRYNVVSAVAGTRVDNESSTPNRGVTASDWAIMRLDCGRTPDGSVSWCPQNALVAPMAMANTAPVGTAIRRMGYDRDPFRHNPVAMCPPYNSPIYPNDETDACGGACFVPGGCNNPNNNNWFQEGVRDDDCIVNSNTDLGGTDLYLVTNCSARGGSSGSPIIQGNTIIGITHGADEMPDDAACQIGLDQFAGAQGPAAGRFMHAPRFASNVAVSYDDTGTARTKVWAVDSDAGTIRSRNRTGTSLNDGWNPWLTKGAMGNEPRTIAAMPLSNSRPQVVVANASGDLWVSFLDATTPPGVWITTTWDKPSASATIRDVDSAPDRLGNPYVFAVSDHVAGQAWRRTRVSNPYGTWLAWQAIVTGDSGLFYRRVSAVRRSGDLKQMAFFVTNTGALRWVAEPFPATAATLSGSLNVVDADAGLAADNKVFVVALDSSGALWMRTQTSTSGNLWPNGWVAFTPPLFNTNTLGCGSTLSGIVSVTASRWMEGVNTEPVIFATDNQGNVYYSEYTTGQCQMVGTCDCGGPKWQPWKSFYHSKRWADY